MKPGFLSVFSALLILLLVVASQSQAQSQRDDRPRSATVSGSVTIEGKPAPGVVVVLESSSGRGEPEPFTARTDGEGMFRIEGVPPGEFWLKPLAYTYAQTQQNQNMPNSRRVVLGAGESVDGITIELVRGCVVTGRVVDEGGNPVVGARVGLQIPRREGELYSRYVAPSLLSNEIGETDDRGVYRIFGVPAGRYLALVRLFTAPHEDSASYVTYYPNTADESKAELIDLAPGEEKTGVDIRLVPPAKTYKASGRLVEASSGRPIPGIYVDCERLDGNHEKMTLVEGAPAVRMTNDNGYFTIVGLQPGEHRLSIFGWQGEGGYAEPVTFEIVNDDVNGLELKARRGASVSGFVVVEGFNNPQLLSRFRPTVQSRMKGENSDRPGSSSRALAEPDGSFRLSGMRAGEFVIRAEVHPPNKRVLAMDRVEMGGQPAQDTIRLEEDQHLSGVRIVMVYGSNIAHGRVMFQNGEPPKGVCFGVSARRAKDNIPGFSVFSYYGARVSGNGQYIVENLPPGDYTLTLTAHYCDGGKWAGIESITQTVKVTNGVEARADFVVDLSKKNQR